MAELSAAQLEFLRSQGISPGMLFDASGLRRKDYSRLMDDLGVYFAFGVSECSAGGHSIRTKFGHCIQCDTSKIAYATRHAKGGFVYVAASQTAALTKIGMSSNLLERVNNINAYQYGGASDWLICCYAEVDEAGHVEFQTQDMLAEFRVDGDYIRAGRRQKCYELFRCSSDVAENALALCAPAGSVKWPD